MEPTTTTPAAPPTAGQALVEFIRTQRENAAYALLGIGSVLLIVTAFLAYKSFKVTAPETTDPAIEKPLDPTAPEPPKPTKDVNPKRGDYTVGWISCLMAALISVSIGAWLLLNIAPPGIEQQVSNARVTVLAVGLLIGAELILTGGVFFFRWADSLASWLDKGEVKEARWVLIPLMMVVAGAGLVFAAIQPARAEERNNSTIRRLVYGANFGLTVLLLTVALVVANVLFAIKVPNKLDTTETGFYSLADSTKSLLSRLDQPVNAYTILPDSAEREVSDIRQLLLACQDASDGKFKVKFLSAVANKTDLANLAVKYPQLDLVLAQRNSIGAVLITAGEDEKRHAVIPASEFFSFEGRQQSFQGETRLFKEIAFLGDSQTKAVVYFTQSNGELTITGGQETQPDQSASRIKEYLEKNYLDVKPLTFPAQDSSVPDDATVVVVAEPRMPFSESTVGALRKFMNAPRAEGKKGKLIVLAGANAGPDGKVAKTGLEGLLTEFNVRLGDKFIYNKPNPFMRSPLGVIAEFTRDAAQNAVYQSLVKVQSGMELLLPREVSTLGANQTINATILLHSRGVTWVEDERPTDLQGAFDELQNSPIARRNKGYSDAPRPLAVLASEGSVGRVAVFGNSLFVTNAIAQRNRSQSAPIQFDLFGVTVDWLRDRPSIAASGIEAKKYKEYQFPQPATVDGTRLTWFPLGLSLLVVVGLGAGVWVTRRKSEIVTR